jgi:hypothetical protein
MQNEFLFCMQQPYMRRGKGRSLPGVGDGVAGVRLLVALMEELVADIGCGRKKKLAWWLLCR